MNKREKLFYNSFLLWLNWLIGTPKKTWKKQIRVKAQQIFREMNEVKIEQVSKGDNSEVEK
jgi:ABC-type tungstate transport system permease subunit